MHFLIVFLAFYALATCVAAYLITDGFKIQFSVLAAFMIAILWPFFLYLIAVSWYEEWLRK